MKSGAKIELIGKTSEFEGDGVLLDFTPKFTPPVRS